MVASRRIEEPGPRLWRGLFKSSWSVPPQCEYGIRSSLRDDVSRVKSPLKYTFPFGSRVQVCSAKGNDSGKKQHG